MAETDAVFGGEHSGHFYFRDFWRADSGMLAALHVLAALAEQDRPLSELLAEYSRYVATGEINSTVADQAAVVAEIEQTYGARDGVTLDHLDGLTVTHPDWWFNVRASNTEPLLRLNAEAADAATLDAAARRRARHDQERLMNLDPALLEIVVCPDCRGALAVDDDRRRAGVHLLRAGLPGPRRHPGAARRRGTPTREPARSGHGRDLRRLAARRRGRARDVRPDAAAPRRGRRPGPA